MRWDLPQREIAELHHLDAIGYRGGLKRSSFRLTLAYARLLRSMGTVPGMGWWARRARQRLFSTARHHQPYASKGGMRTFKRTGGLR